MLIFRRIFLSNYWWQKSDISSQASYRYLISWETLITGQDYPCQHIDQRPRKTRESTTALATKKKKHVYAWNELKLAVI